MSDASCDCDLLVIGGGINGVGIARDAAGRGLSVVLCEKDDLASHTSSASSKLIHGGLRYLEHYEFGLVRKALIEREILMRSAPHIISPLRFVMPHEEGLRPAWLLRCGLFLYDHLAHRELLPDSSAIDLRQHVAGRALKNSYSQGFAYSDGWVDDARLVVLCALDAAERGARILTRTRCESAVRSSDAWDVTLCSESEKMLSIKARCIVNATGAWSVRMQQNLLSDTFSSAAKLRLIKGSHVVVPSLFDHDHAYIFQNSDGRIVFALPYERDFSLIGTTDLDYHGDLNQVRISADEIDYLCNITNHYFERQIHPSDVVWSYSGLRPLLDDGNADAKSITRDYRFVLDTSGAPLLSVFGGKITTFRKLAQEAVDDISALLDCTRPAWTEHALLPGGDLPHADHHTSPADAMNYFVSEMQRQYAWLPPALVRRYALAYGTRIHVLLYECRSLQDLGEQIAPNLYAAEVRYLKHHEWANTAEDILWRRTKLGLHLDDVQKESLKRFLGQTLILS
jgi:glycerol-3-phosphate dehydrogenase